MSKVAPKTDASPSDDVEFGIVLERAFAQHQSEILGTLFHLVGNMEDARDALQESFLKCWRHRAEVGDIDNLRAWMFRIALNTGRDMRQTAWRRKRTSLPENDDMLPGNHATPHEHAAHQEELTRVRSAVGKLRSEEQEVFLLRQNGQLSYEQIAESIGIPLGTVKTRMRMALTNLRQVLAET